MEPNLMSKMKSTWLLIGMAGSLLAGFGCKHNGPEKMPTDAERVEMFSLMLPKEIKFQPFTKIKSFNENERPDGILAVIRPLDPFGDPVKAAGRFYFELWTYREASPERKGERLAFWERQIASKEEVRLYWTRAQMYEFQLAWVAGVEKLRPGQKYILTATYRAPWDETLRDERVVRMPTVTQAVAGEEE
jgi:hypothetical protein